MGKPIYHLSYLLYTTVHAFVQYQHKYKNFKNLLSHIKIENLWLIIKKSHDDLSSTQFSNKCTYTPT